MAMFSIGFQRWILVKTFSFIRPLSKLHTSAAELVELMPPSSQAQLKS